MNFSVHTFQIVGKSRAKWVTVHVVVGKTVRSEDKFATVEPGSVRVCSRKNWLVIIYLNFVKSDVFIAKKTASW